MILNSEMRTTDCSRVESNGRLALVPLLPLVKPDVWMKGVGLRISTRAISRGNFGLVGLRGDSALRIADLANSSATNPQADGARLANLVGERRHREIRGRRAGLQGSVPLFPGFQIRPPCAALALPAVHAPAVAVLTGGNDFRCPMIPLRGALVFCETRSNGERISNLEMPRRGNAGHR